MTATALTYDRRPDRYQHWRLEVAGAVATLALDVAEDKALQPSYRLKLNSYDLGVDMELHDALQRIRFEHPEVKVVVVASAKERMFCSGANIYMLGLASHAWKVNFCKFTNETRNGMEDSSRHDGLRFVAALNGTAAGGGYELALACDEIVMVDDGFSAVSMPEVPLLGVLPGTGGLTRITDKRRVRRDLADFFCTTSEGVRAERALQWRLVDHIAKPQAFAAALRERVAALAAASPRCGAGPGISLTPLAREIDGAGYHYEYVDAAIDRRRRTVSITVSGPTRPQPEDPAAIVQAGASWWPLQMARELDDAILCLRSNEQESSLWTLRTRGELARVLAVDAALAAQRDHWLVRETIGMLRRTLARLEISSRSIFALIDQGSCFGGTLAELAFAADRSYMLELPAGALGSPCIALSALNFGAYPTPNGRTRLATRFCGDRDALARATARCGEALRAEQAAELGLVTFTPDELDWDDEIRIASEERANLSPDALTGMEASLRFPGDETMWTRIFGRLTAWQNWIFLRPNAVGEQGALQSFGTGRKASFHWERV